MIIFKDKTYATNFQHPNSDWTGKALYVIDDNSELASRIRKYYPNYDFVVEKGVLIDITPKGEQRIIEEPKTLEDEIQELKQRVAELEQTARS